VSSKKSAAQIEHEKASARLAQAHGATSKAHKAWQDAVSAEQAADHALRDAKKAASDERRRQMPKDHAAEIEIKS